MTFLQTVVLAVLAVAMLAAALTLGSWSAQVNPDGIQPHPAADQGNATAPLPTDQASAAESAAEGAGVEESTAGDPFSFGMSMGLLGMSLMYCCIALGLFIQSRAQKKEVGMFTFCVAGLAGIGFVLSYVVDGYFY
jgi:hypothetical protein